MPASARKLATEALVELVKPGEWMSFMSEMLPQSSGCDINTQHANGCLAQKDLAAAELLHMKPHAT